MIHPRPGEAPTERERCLDAARAVVMHRGGQYRPPVPFFVSLARRWTLLLGVEIAAREVILCLIELKLERAKGAPHKDTVVDIAGYAACLAEIDAFFADATCTIPRGARDVRPGEPWVFQEHRTMAEVAAAESPPPARSPHWPRVMRFAAAMDEKLGENLAKGDWRDHYTFRDVNGTMSMLDLLNGEVQELTRELDRAPDALDPAAIRREAADVANFALMIADLFGGGLGSV